MPTVKKTAPKKVAPEAEVDEAEEVEAEEEETSEEIEFVNTKFEDDEFDRITYLSEALGITKKEAANTFYHVMESIQYATYYNGSCRTDIGTFNYTEVPERSGVSKMGGKETPWTKEEHVKCKFKESRYFSDFLNDVEDEEEE